MSNRQHLMCLAAFTALVAFSGIARADDSSTADAAGFARSEAGGQPMTCAQATAFAWFKHQMELPDFDNPIETPAECTRTYVANDATAQGDREVVEESK